MEASLIPQLPAMAPPVEPVEEALSVGLPQSETSSNAPSMLEATVEAHLPAGEAAVSAREGQVAGEGEPPRQEGNWKAIGQKFAG